LPESVDCSPEERAIHEIDFGITVADVVHRGVTFGWATG